MNQESDQFLEGCQWVNFPITGKKTGNFFRLSRKTAWIAGFCEGCGQKQGINREFIRKHSAFNTQHSVPWRHLRPQGFLLANGGSSE
jgi:hypothetical protein